MQNGFSLNHGEHKTGKYSREVEKPLFFLYLSNKDTNVSELTQTALYNIELRKCICIENFKFIMV